MKERCLEADDTAFGKWRSKQENNLAAVMLGILALKCTTYRLRSNW